MNQNSTTQFAAKYALQSYFALLLLFLAANNINAVFPGSKSKYSDELEERIHQAILTVLILVGCCLYGGHLYKCRKMVAAIGHTRSRRREKFLPTRIVFLMWVMNIITTVFHVWSLFWHVAVSGCEGLVRIPLYDPHRSFMFLSDYVFYVALSAYLVLQTAWIYYMNKYKSKYSAMQAFTIIHGVAVNLAIYIKMTLFEARETFERIVADVTHHHHHSHYKCGRRNLTGILKSMESTHTNFIEVWGFAFSIESILTLAVFALAFRLEEEEQNVERRKLQQRKSQDSDQIGSIGSSTLNIDKSNEVLPESETITDRKQESECQCCRSLTSNGWTKLATWTALAGIFIVPSGFVYAIYLFVAFAGAAEDIVDVDTHLQYLVAELLTTCWILLVLAFNLRTQQKRRRRKLHIESHALLDIDLLRYGMCGAWAIDIFALIGCVLPWHSASASSSQYHNSTWATLKAVQALSSVLKTGEVLAQVFFLSQAFGYRISRWQRAWAQEFFCVVLLLIYNLLQWGVSLFSRHYTFNANVVASRFYNNLLWAVITEVCYPIAIFFRFHGVVLSVTLLGTHFLYGSEGRRASTFSAVVRCPECMAKFMSLQLAGTSSHVTLTEEVGTQVQLLATHENFTFIDNDDEKN